MIKVSHTPTETKLKTFEYRQIFYRRKKKQ